MLLMDSLAYHEPLVRSPALGPLCSWKLAGTPPPHLPRAPWGAPPSQKEQFSLGKCCFFLIAGMVLSRKLVFPFVPHIVSWGN